jgi:membrane protein implicated in regulation of membrane protease activity
MALTLFAFFGLVLRKAVQARRLAPTTSGGSLLGMTGVVRRRIGGEQEAGSVFVDGELWRAHSPAAVDVGASVRVTRVQGLEIDVEPVVGEARKEP